MIASRITVKMLGESYFTTVRKRPFHAPPSSVHCRTFAALELGPTMSMPYESLQLVRVAVRPLEVLICGSLWMFEEKERDIAR